MKVEVRHDPLKDKPLVVYTQDFDDNYHRTEDQPSSELEKQARKIRRRYAHVSDYNMASAIYNDYMALLVDKYGGPEFFKLRLKGGVIHDFIPPRPRMKNNAFNRYVKKHRIVISPVNKKKGLNWEVLESLEPEYMNRDVPDKLVGTDHDIDKRLIKQAANVKIKVNHKDLREINNIDYLEEFFHMKNKRTVEDYDDTATRFSLGDVISGKADEMVARDTSDSDDVIIFNGRYMNRESVEELQLFRMLGEWGHNSVRLMRQNKVSKKVQKIMKDQDHEKHKKKKKKKNKKNVDRFLIDMTGDNDFDSFEDFNRDYLNMTSDNIFG
ncbi:hypothetical protein D1872_36630 [compost metagenome]